MKFSTDMLGFEVHWRMANYAYVYRQTVGFRLLKKAGPAARESPVCLLD